uniref:Putative bioproteinsis of lysosome-related organelles complex 1 subunit n=1 Tax=Ixodes ricinus TaxID=34613 RepID=V5I4F7_IXORI
MLSSLLKEHQQRQACAPGRSRGKEKRSHSCVQCSHNRHGRSSKTLGLPRPTCNQKKLDAEVKQLHSNAANFAKQTTNWLHLVDNFNHALEGAGGHRKLGQET